MLYLFIVCRRKTNCAENTPPPIFSSPKKHILCRATSKIESKQPTPTSNTHKMKHRIITSHQPCFLLALAAHLVVVFFSYNNSAYTTTATTDVVFVESYVVSSSYKYGTSAASIASIGRRSLSSSSFQERSYSSRSRSSSSIYNRSRCCCWILKITLLRL